MLAVFVLISMILAACAPAAPATTEAPPPVETEAPMATEEPVVTEAPATEEPMATEAPTEAMPARELLWTQGLRQAIAAAIDREVIVDRVFEGRNTPAYHMVPSDYPFATESFLDN